MNIKSYYQVFNSFYCLNFKKTSQSAGALEYNDYISEEG